MSLDSFERQRSIGPAKTKTVGEGHGQFHRLRLPYMLQSIIVVQSLQIQRRRQYLIDQRLHDKRRFEGPGGAQQVPGGPLGAADGHVGTDLGNRLRFDGVAEGRGRGVGIDVVDLALL